MAVRLRFQIHKMSGRELPLALLFERPTIEELAQVLRQQIPVSVSSLIPIKPAGSKPPLFFVQHFRARDRKLRDDPALGWSELMSGGIETHTAPGDHISMLNQPNVQILAHKLAACLDSPVRCNNPRKAAKSA